jgi:type II restriction/modification system DNA methylase subunit YeeA
VRHLGSIYEGLLEFKLRVAGEDLTTQEDKKAEKYVALSQAKVKRGRQAEVVVRKKDVYLSNDRAERKASGSYYTPDPIVEYIVAQTVGPVLDRKLEALRPAFQQVRKTFDRELQKSQDYPSAQVRKKEMDHRQWALLQTWNGHKDLVERFFDLKVLDPAMGSGHFLVEAVDFITDRLLKFLNEFKINPVNLALDRTRSDILASLGEQGVTVDTDSLTDINLLKRHVLKRCIYGVDLNPMAVELAKVSLWLDAFTLGAPLSFLDHHLRCGNSLVGSTFRELEQTAESLFAIK